MKRKDLLLLTFLLSQTAPVWAMDTSQDQDNLDRKPLISAKSLLKKNQPSALHVQQLKDKIRNATVITESRLARLEEQNPFDTKVVVLGATGSGKSTLINLLAGKVLIVNEDFRINVTNPVEGSEIGDSITSTTAYPSFSLCEELKNTVLCDSPGSGDSSGPQQDIVNLGTIRKVSSGPVKLLVTIAEEDLGGVAAAFLKQIDYITKIFPYAQLEESLSLVITKQAKKGITPHKRLRELIADNSKGDNRYLMTEDVRKLLQHLTQEENIKTRIPYFPFPEAEGEYKSEDVRENILESIRSLKPMVNPKMQMQLSSESTLLVSQLAKDLNQDIERSIQTILRPKIRQLCQQYTTAYGSDKSLPGLENALATIKSALTLLEKDSAENLMKFSGSFDDFFDQDEDNVVKECVQTLLFLQTFQHNISCSTKAWAHVLQPTLDDIHELIDILGNKLFGKITTFLETINLSVLECCRILPESENAEREIETFSQKLQDLNTAMMALQSGAPKDKISCVKILGNLSRHNSVDAIESFMGALGFLNTLKPLTYPLSDWLQPLNASMKHLKIEIANQQKFLDLNRRLEEEGKMRTALEEAARNERMALEEKARQERKEAATQLKTLYEKAEAHRLAREEEVRKERATLKEAARKERAALEEKARLEREALQEETRLEREETLRRIEKQHEDHRANLQQHEEYTLLQQQILQQKEEALSLQKAETERIRKEEEALRMTLEQSQRLLFTEAEQQWATEREKQNNEREEQRKALTATIENQNLVYAALVKQLEENTRQVENLRQQHEQQQKQHAETLRIAQEEMALKMRSLEEKAVLDRQARLDEINQEKITIQKFEARVADELQVAARQLAMANQNAQSLTLQLAQANQEKQRLQTEKAEAEKEAARQRILRNNRPNAVLTLNQYNLLKDDERRVGQKPKMLHGKRVMENGKPAFEPVYFRK